MRLERLNADLGGGELLEGRDSLEEVAGVEGCGGSIGEGEGDRADKGAARGVLEGSGEATPSRMSPLSTSTARERLRRLRRCDRGAKRRVSEVRTVTARSWEYAMENLLNTSNRE